ncbi:endonuclease/exonuclease/phosphatase family protein [Ammoniphilus sp. 3BR4]|uniref:endonuclease/exonuclease/phosphatase family protein n=1 Tax=Ammoniphilus sp. 3BR4 TaxID=3158265 RepID=UPI0034656CFA
MKLLTLNCHSWQEENQMEKIKCLAETIQAEDYDVIALQEVSQLHRKQEENGRVSEDNYVRVLLDELEKLEVYDYQAVWDLSHLAYEEKYEEGLALLTKHPIEQANSFFISRSQDIHRWKTRKIVGAKIRINEELISFYSCHLGWWHDEEEPFKHQVDNLLRQAKKDEPYFLMGDFNNNAFIEGEGYDYLSRQGVYDTYELAEERDDGVTVSGAIAGWSKSQEDKRIDFIFASKPVSVKRSSIIFNGANRPMISDHFGLEIEL